MRSYVPLCCGPSESAAAKDTGLCLLYFITSTNPVLQYFYESPEGLESFFRALVYSGVFEYLAEYFSYFLF